VTAWPLAALHGVRRRAEEAARVALAEACAREGRARSERDVAAAGVAAAEAARVTREREDAAGTAEALQTRARFAARLRDEERIARVRLEAAEHRVRESSEVLARARVKLEGARRALEALERRRAAWEEARRRDRERAEEAVSDDRPPSGGDR
jgi:hypothetical protein